MKYILCFLLFISNNIEAYQYDLSLCAIFQNEAPYLKEWIEFHKLVGVQHFWLYNNLSTDNYKEILDPYIMDGSLELIEWPYSHECILEWNSIQCNAYNDAITKSVNKTKWLIVIDTDEFIFPVQCYSLIEFLKGYENQVGLCVNWQMFGTSRINRIKPNELLIEKLTLKAPFNFHAHTHVKSIVRPEYVEYFENPHYANYKYNLSQSNPDHINFKGAVSPYCCIDKIRINHYWLRDEYFMWNNKFPRRINWSTDYERDKQHWLIENEKMNIIEDRIIFKYIEILKNKLFMLP